MSTHAEDSPELKGRGNLQAALCYAIPRCRLYLRWRSHAMETQEKGYKTGARIRKTRTHTHTHTQLYRTVGKCSLYQETTGSIKCLLICRTYIKQFYTQQLTLFCDAAQIITHTHTNDTTRHRRHTEQPRTVGKAAEENWHKIDENAATFVVWQLNGNRS